MPFESAKCPTCGATIQVQPDSESAFCSSCGNKLIPKQAIAQLKLELEINKPVPVKGLSSVENDLLRGKQCLEVKDWDKAFIVFGSAVDKQADNFNAWYGLLLAVTRQFSNSDLYSIQIDGEKGLASILRNCSRYLSIENNESYNQKIKSLVELWDQNQKYNDTRYRTAKSVEVFWVLCAIVCLFIFCVSLLNANVTGVFISILLVPIVGILGSSSSRKRKQRSEILQVIDKKLSEIRNLIESTKSTK